MRQKRWPQYTQISLNTTGDLDSCCLCSFLLGPGRDAKIWMLYKVFRITKTFTAGCALEQLSPEGNGISAPTVLEDPAWGHTGHKCSPSVRGYPLI